MHVYYNLTRRCFSIKDPSTGLVINKGENTQYVLMRHVMFKRGIPYNDAVEIFRQIVAAT